MLILLLVGTLTGGWPAPQVWAVEEPRNATEQAAEIAERMGAQSELPEHQVDAAEFPSAPLPMAKLLLYLLALLAIAAVVVTVAMLVQRFVGGRPKPPPPIRTEGGASLPAWAQVEMGDPEQLARAGRYTEAIHALLLLALRKLMNESGGSFSDSLTSREVLRKLKLPSVRRGSMLQLIHASEVAWFGGVEADDTRFADCRRLFDRVLERGSA